MLKVRAGLFDTHAGRIWERPAQRTGSLKPVMLQLTHEVVAVPKSTSPHLKNIYTKKIYEHNRLGKYACPCVLDHQKLRKKTVDDQKINSGRPHLFDL